VEWRNRGKIETDTETDTVSIMKPMGILSTSQHACHGHGRLQATGATGATGRDLVSAVADDFGQGNIEASTVTRDLEMTWK